MEVGFVGLGRMGGGMVERLLAAGHRVRVWNRSPGPMAELVQQGAVAAASVAEAFAAEAVLSMLANDEAVRQTVLEDDVLAAGRGGVHVNLATVSVALAQELAERHAAAGMGYVAAPVFGRPDAAAAGKLHIVVAGTEAAIAMVQPLLDAMGQRSWPVGIEPHRANIVKIAGNFMLAAAIEAMAEAAALVQAHGVTPAAMLEILTGTLFAAPAYQGYGRMIAEGSFEPAGFAMPLGLKDVRLALAAGEARHVPLPFAGILRDNLLDALAHGGASKDWSALAEVATRRAGLDRQQAEG